jgi:hypothetical protein
MLTTVAKGHLQVQGARRELSRAQRAVIGHDCIRDACFRVMFVLCMATSSHMFRIERTSSNVRGVQYPASILCSGRKVPWPLIIQCL